jgi:serine/threonine protein kinase
MSQTAFIPSKDKMGEIPLIGSSALIISKTLLGCGAFGEVYEAKWKCQPGRLLGPEKDVAVKQFFASANTTAIQQFVTQANVLFTLDHRNILKV